MSIPNWATSSLRWQRLQPELSCQLDRFHEKGPLMLPLTQLDLYLFQKEQEIERLEHIEILKHVLHDGYA